MPEQHNTHETDRGGRGWPRVDTAAGDEGIDDPDPSLAIRPEPPTDRVLTGSLVKAEERS